MNKVLVVTDSDIIVGMVRSAGTSHTEVAVAAHMENSYEVDFHRQSFRVV